MPGIEPVLDVARDGFVGKCSVPTVAIGHGGAASKIEIAADVAIHGCVRAVISAGAESWIAKDVVVDPVFLED